MKEFKKTNLTQEIQEETFSGRLQSTVSQDFIARFFIPSMTSKSPQKRKTMNKEIQDDPRFHLFFAFQELLGFLFQFADLEREIGGLGQKVSKATSELDGHQW